MRKTAGLFTNQVLPTSLPRPTYSLHCTKSPENVNRFFDRGDLERVAGFGPATPSMASKKRKSYE